MKFEGKDGVLTHYLIDLGNRSGDDSLTVAVCTQCLGVLARLLGNLCGVTELERVETKHLHECVQSLLTVPVAVFLHVVVCRMVG